MCGAEKPTGEGETEMSEKNIHDGSTLESLRESECYEDAAAQALDAVIATIETEITKLQGVLAALKKDREVANPSATSR